MIQLKPGISASQFNKGRKGRARARIRRGTGTQRAGLHFKRVFSDAKSAPFDEMEWERRIAEITDDGGKIIFKQDNIEVPADWSELATKIAVSKYFYGDIANGTDPEKGGRETSVRQLIHRVTRTIADWGLLDGYFADAQTADLFYDELTWLCLNQHGAFNSPVWFNVGLYQQYGIGNGAGEGNYFYNRETGTADRAATQYEYPQGSACFIQSVDDTMEDIMRLATSEAMLFKFGSGTGTDLSTLRSYREKLAGGGKPSGPLSFMRVYDQIAAVVKSGGKTRRAAKMQSLKIWHPDILEFIECKWKEEKKAHCLIEKGGYEANFNGEAYSSILFQNANLSVRVTDEFMEAVEKNQKWTTHWVTEPSREGPSWPARELLNRMADCAWHCGDPGVQYDTTINKWHTCPNSGRINASNPCSEYMFLDNSACNLASLNLMKFRREDGELDVESFKHAVEIVITAQEILVDNASYPTPGIEKNSHDYRPLGMGYANLGALLMSLGIPYDSDKGRTYSAAISALMSGHAYSTSSLIAKRLGPFRGYLSNEKPFLNVIGMHRSNAYKIPRGDVPRDLVDAAVKSWDEALSLGERFGFKNAQISVIAPTGTIAFMMDCDTTGIEPDIALVKYKWLVGGGVIKIVNNTVPEALRRLGYSLPQTDEILRYLQDNDTIEGAPHLRPEHLAVFDCAFKPSKGTRSIHYMGHVKMMSAVQPFISGAISKTVNMPNAVTVDEIMQTYVNSWKMGLKAIAIYRDGSKRTQPLTTSLDEKEKVKPLEKVAYKPLRKRCPISATRRFTSSASTGTRDTSWWDSTRTD